MSFPLGSCTDAFSSREPVPTLLENALMPDLIRTFAERGDLAHLALFLWAASASALLHLVLRDYAAAMRRFDDFVRELSRFNERKLGRADDDGQLCTS